jgi:hypothetical protein
METTAEPPTQPIIKYSPAEAEIALLKEKYGHLKADTPQGYDDVSRALRLVVGARTSIEARRKELKADSLAWGRKVDATAGKLFDLIAQVEAPLRAEKDRVDAEKEAKARAIVEAEKARVAELERQVREKEEAERKAARDAEEARLKAARDAEEARQAVERKLLAEEAAKLAEERRAHEAERQTAAARFNAEQAAIAKAQREAQEKIDAERRKLAEEKERLDRIEFERVAKEKAIEKARLEVERETAIGIAEAERHNQERRAREVEEKAEAARMEAAKPDVAKIREFGAQLNLIHRPGLHHKEASDFMDLIMKDLAHIAEFCKAYKFKKGA